MSSAAKQQHENAEGEEYSNRRDVSLSETVTVMEGA